MHAGMPCTEQITQLVTRGENITRNGDSTYGFGSPPLARYGMEDEFVTRIIQFLGRLKKEIDSYYSRLSERSTNYEDLYYVASQISDSEIGQIDNPVVQSFIVKVMPDIKPLFISKNYEVKKQWNIHDLAWETTNYIEDVVWQVLSSKPTSLDYLHFIKDACQDDLLADMNIFTLNHDRILELLLRADQGIPFTDGFSEPLNNVRRWNPDLFNCELYKVRLFKLHGSIDWFRIKPKGDDGSNQFIGIPVDWEYPSQSTMNQQCGTILERIYCRPKILVGTFNKMLNYLEDIYANLFCLFYRHLSNAKRLVISGYGFGDQGINTRIIEWCDSSSDRKITIIHPDPMKLKAEARGAVSVKLDAWPSRSKLEILQKRIEDHVTWAEISDTF